MNRIIRELLELDVKELQNYLADNKLTYKEYQDIRAKMFKDNTQDKFSIGLVNKMNKKLKVKYDDKIIGKVVSAKITPKGIKYKAVLNVGRPKSVTTELNNDYFIDNKKRIKKIFKSKVKSFSKSGAYIPISQEYKEHDVLVIVLKRGKKK
jgi:hypothetical protein